MNKLDDILQNAIRLGQKTLAIAAAEEEHVLEAVKLATHYGFIKPIFIGTTKSIKNLCKKIEFDISSLEIVHSEDHKTSSELAVKLVKGGKAEMLMKGKVSSGIILKAVLNKNSGIVNNHFIGHVAVFESPFYHKLIGVTDAAINISPNISEKETLIHYAVDVFHSLGIKRPKVALLAPVEVVNPKIQSTIEAAELVSRFRQKANIQFVVDGPLALDNAVSAEAAWLKNIQSEVAGDADILLTPDINSGNILYKSLNFLGGATSAAIVVGAKAPIVLTSRSDSTQTKLMSLALGAVVSSKHS